MYVTFSLGAEALKCLILQLAMQITLRNIQNISSFKYSNLNDEVTMIRSSSHVFILAYPFLYVVSALRCLLVCLLCMLSIFNVCMWLGLGFAYRDE